MYAVVAVPSGATGHFSWCDRNPSPRAVHAESHGIYGSVKIARELQTRVDVEHACRNTVAKAMREMGLKSRIKHAFRPTTTRVDPARHLAPNTLAQDFTATAPNRKWVADVTYPATAQGWVCVSPVFRTGAGRG